MAYPTVCYLPSLKSCLTRACPVFWWGGDCSQGIDVTLVCKNGKLSRLHVEEEWKDMQTYAFMVPEEEEREGGRVCVGADLSRLTRPTHHLVRGTLFTRTAGKPCSPRVKKRNPALLHISTCNTILPEFEFVCISVRSR